MAIGLEKEFEKKENIYEPHELARESKLLSLAYSGNKENLRERYLSSKKIVNLDSNGRIRAVVKGMLEEYTKYDTIYRKWLSSSFEKVTDLTPYKA